LKQHGRRAGRNETICQDRPCGLAAHRPCCPAWRFRFADGALDEFRALIDKPVPEFELAAVEGHGQPGFSTADLAGNGVVVVNVFASWCVPCRAEHPFLMELANEPVEIYGLNYDDPAENARAFLAELGNPYDRVGADRDRRVGIEWGVYGVPETFIVDNEGIIRFKHVGPLDQESYENVLLPAIEAVRTPG
jgi:cytochrome c biogenesis protein CcmG/thiol:disulfide interchange protein DsbE